MAEQRDRRKTYVPPERPAWLAKLNELGKLMDAKSIIPLDEESLCRQAMLNTGLSDFGEDGWRDRFRVILEAIECEAKLTFTDFHPRFDYHAIISQGQRLGGAAHHFEVSGRMTGTIRIGDREMAVDALGYRDRSWAHRDWSQTRGTRWWPCVFGPDLTTHIIHLVQPGGVMKVGYVWRDGQTIPIVDSDVLVSLESDALTPRTGEGVLHLANGEILRVSCDRSDGIVMHVRGYNAVETIGTALLDGRRGMSNLEVCTNASRGRDEPVVAIGANLTDGLSRRP